MIEAPWLIDIQSLIATSFVTGPVSTLPYDLRDELDRMREGEWNISSGGSEATSARAPRSSGWEKIIRLTQDWMAHQSKDMGLSARLAEALTKVHGTAGLRDGMTLLRRITEECWEQVTPLADTEEGLESRLAPLEWLDDPDRGALFPGTVRLIVILGGSSKSYSWVDWQRIQARSDAEDWKEFERTLKETPIAICREKLAHFLEAEQEVDRLVRAIRERSERVNFDMPALKQAIRDCVELARMMVNHHPDRDLTPTNNVALTSFDQELPTELTDSSGYQTNPTMYTREQIYESIGQLAEMLREIEPHSPVPYLLRRAVELGSLPFPRLMKELVKEPGSLGRLFQEMGISEGL